MELVTVQTSYRSHPQFNISDHKPVTSEFTINVSLFYAKKMKNHVFFTGLDNEKLLDATTFLNRI